MIISEFQRKKCAIQIHFSRWIATSALALAMEKFSLAQI